MGLVNQIDTISQPDFDSLLHQYPKVVPSKLKDLDIIRYSTIPHSKPSHLTHDEVLHLVDWKLSHGTFRPKLKQLVESNCSDLVEVTTKSAFASFDATPEKAASCLKELTILKGIGPATASLLLSAHDPENAPFFSDELFRWCMWKAGKGTGWDRPIKYTPKEYAELFGKVAKLRERIGVSAVDAERVAYVLGKTAKESMGGGKAGATAVKRKANDDVKVPEKVDPPAKKPKSGKVKEPARATRSSARINASEKRGS